MRDSTQHLVTRTAALRRVLGNVADSPSVADFLFLEEWERQPSLQLGSALRATQIRRANPQLAAEIRAELKRGRPLTDVERRALLMPPPSRRPPRRG